MTIELLVVWIALAGAGGGFLNAIMATGGLILPHFETLERGERQFVLGFLNNVFVGAGAALILGFLYGPLGDLILGQGGNSASPLLTMRSLAGAGLSGIGGARLLTQEADKKYNQSSKESLARTVANLAGEENANAVTKPKQL